MRLRRLARRAESVVSSGRSASGQTSATRRQAARVGRLSRRDWGKASAGLSVALGLTQVGCSDSDSDETPENPSTRVAVVGAGLAGLHCAWRLMQAGVDVSVYEASSRVGGRTFTDRGTYSPQVCELGGELVDANHRFMWALCEELGLELDDRRSGEYADKALDTWFISGRVVTDETLLEQFTNVVGDVVDAVDAADSDDAAFEELDQTSLSDWLAEHVPEDSYPELHAVLTAAYRGEFGLEPEEQSALNLVYLIGTDDTTFAIFGESDERYHIHGGNDQITTLMAEDLRDRVKLGHRLAQVALLGGKYELTFRAIAAADEASAGGAGGAESSSDSVRAKADYVVFALPFTQLRKVDLNDAGLSSEKLEIIERLGYGTNAKLMGAFTSRVWATEHQASGSVTSDLPLQQTWETSIGQEGEQGILTNFLGGDVGLASDAGSAEARFTSILADLDGIYPGAASAYIEGSAVRMHWPSHPFTEGSYTCYRPGQWAYWGTEGLPEGRAHFCGEHTSPEFQGWMEGAAETGGRVAIEILNDLGVKVPEALARVVDEYTALPDQQLLSTHFPRRLRRVRAKRRP
jgi:monoamine oxidase